MPEDRKVAEGSAPASDTIDDPELYLEFHRVASARKLDLAMRGCPVPNLQIDELFQKVEEQSLKHEQWPAFVREQYPSPREGEPSQHPLVDMTAKMQAALYGEDDIDVYRLAKCVKAFIVIVEKLGRFASISIAEAKSNTQKLEDGIALASASAKGGSLVALLRSEVSAGMHGKGGMIKDPSAAMGVLWIARFIQFWQEICILRAAPAPPSGEYIPLKLTIDGAYKHLLLPYHGCARALFALRESRWTPRSCARVSVSATAPSWPCTLAQLTRCLSLCYQLRRWVTQKAFEMAVGGAPEWDAVRPALAPSDDEFVEDFAGFRKASTELLNRIFKALEELDLVDVRKSV